jgi:cytochrome c oxidase assembly protein subunit 15
LFEGRDTLSWIVHRHATIAALFGVIAIGVWLVHRHRRSADGVLEPLTVLCVLLAGEGLVGSVQYELHLPADMVWVHVTLATLIWVTTLWAVAAAGRLAPRSVPQLAAEPSPSARGFQAAGKTG